MEGWKKFGDRSKNCRFEVVSNVSHISKQFMPPRSPIAAVLNLG